MQWPGPSKPPCLAVIRRADGADLKLVSGLTFISMLIFDGSSRALSQQLTSSAWTPLASPSKPASSIICSFNRHMLRPTRSHFQREALNRNPAFVHGGPPMSGHSCGALSMQFRSSPQQPCGVSHSVLSAVTSICAAGATGKCSVQCTNLLPFTLPVMLCCPQKKLINETTWLELG